MGAKLLTSMQLNKNLVNLKGVQLRTSIKIVEI